MASPQQRAAELSLKFKLVREDIQQALRGVDQTETSIRSLTGEVKASTRETRRYTDAVSDVGRASRRAEQSIDRETAALRKQERALRDVSQASKYERAGDISTALGSLASVTGGGTLGLAGDVAGAIEYLPILSGEIGALGAVAPIAAVAVGALALATKKLMDTIESGKERLKAAIEAQDAYYEAVVGGTTESITAEVEAAENRLEALRMQAQDLQAQIDKRTVEARGREVTPLIGMGPLKDKLEEVQTEIVGAEDELSALNRALKSNQVRARDLDEAEKDLAKTRTSAEDVAKVAELQKQREEEQRQETVAAIDKYNADVEAITEAGFKERLRLEKAFVDKQVAIAEQAVEAEEQALASLEEQYASLRLQKQRDELDAEIDLRRAEFEARLEVQREEARSAREHADRMKDIRREAEAEEQDLALRRDFAGISRLRRETGRRLSEENRQERRRRRERLIALQEEREDLGRHYLEAREDRLRKFEQDNQDARQQYDQELKDIAKKRDKALRLLKQQHEAELRMLNIATQARLYEVQRGIQAELQLIQAGSRARLELERQHQEAALAQARAIMKSSATNTMNATINQTVTGGMSAEEVAHIANQEIGSSLWRMWKGANA